MPDAAPLPTPPTDARFVLAGWLCGLSSILYLDRICMSQAVKPIRADLELSKTEMGFVQIAFIVAYGLFAVPVGRWGDRRGPRTVLALIVFLWSVFTALTSVVTGLLTLMMVRFLFGAAEAGAFPNAARAMSRWYPVSERGRVQGLMLAFAQVGAIVAPAATANLIEASGWRSVFWIYALIGAAWAVGFWFWYRDDPADHPSVNGAELAIIRADLPPPAADPGPVPWHAVFNNRGIIVLAVLIVLGSFFTYFFYGWFPTYLIEAWKVSDVRAGWLSSLAIGGSAVGMLLGGWLSDRITRLSADPIRSRRYLCTAAFLLAAALMFAGTLCNDAISLTVLWSAAMCAMHIQLPNWWSVIIPQSGRHTATLFGLTNGIGVFGALASLGIVPMFADWQERRGLSGRAVWDPIFDVYVLVLVLGAVAWWLYRFTPLPEPAEPGVLEERP